MIRPPPRSTLFPYPTLFRSDIAADSRRIHRLGLVDHVAGVELRGIGTEPEHPQRHQCVGPLAQRQVPVEHLDVLEDRKSTRLNSSHLVISYAVFCLNKKSTR